MNKKIFSLIIFGSVLHTGLAQVSVEGTRMLQYTPANTTGLSSVYILEDAANARIVYTSSSPSAVVWEEFSNLGGGYAREVTPALEGNTLSVDAPEHGMGYIITDGSKRICFWVANYAAYPYSVTGAMADAPDCDRVRIELEGQAPELPYYSINGQKLSVPREVEVTYNTLTFDSDAFTYVETSASQSFDYAEGSLLLASPLCATAYTVHPDRFARQWGHASEVITQTVDAYAVDAQTAAEQTEREADNEQTQETESLGGSAPCEITFKAAITDAAIFKRWEIASTADFIDSFLTFNETEFTYTFTDAGTWYVRFTADNDSGTCLWTSETYTVSIGESRLECPNAFSPGTSEGVNDEWKVSYKSIVQFDCHIFNRWGKTLAHLTDPSQGWDGKVGGKTVGSGVYFYVIKARGSDGIDYNLSGSINVISSRQDTTSGTSVE